MAGPEFCGLLHALRGAVPALNGLELPTLQALAMLAAEFQPAAQQPAAQGPVSPKSQPNGEMDVRDASTSTPSAKGPWGRADGTLVSVAPCTNYNQQLYELTCGPLTNSNNWMSFNISLQSALSVPWHGSWQLVQDLCSSACLASFPSASLRSS